MFNASSYIDEVKILNRFQDGIEAIDLTYCKSDI